MNRLVLIGNGFDFISEGTEHSIYQSYSDIPNKQKSENFWIYKKFPVSL